MGIGDIRYTVLQAVNEVQRKLGLNETSLNNNKVAVQLVDFINDTCNDLSDFGDWQEMITSANVTAVSGQRDYSINTSANIKNIGDIYLSTRTGPLRFITTDDMRKMTRVSSQGTPSQFTLFGTDANGNPNIRVRPTVDGTTSGALFSIVYYVRAPVYTTADTNTVIPFPSDLIVNGTLARHLLNESGGSPTDHYTLIQDEYLKSRKEALNRFQGDTGYNVAFAPSRRGRR